MIPSRRLVERKNSVHRIKTFSAKFAMCLLAGGLALGQAGKDAKDDTVPVRLRAFANQGVRVTLQHKTASPDGKLFAGYYRDGLARIA